MTPECWSSAKREGQWLAPGEAALLGGGEQSVIHELNVGYWSCISNPVILTCPSCQALQQTGILEGGPKRD